MTCHRNPSPTDKNNENSEKTKFEVNTCVQCHCYSKRIIHIVGMQYEWELLKKSEDVMSVFVCI